MIKTLAGGFLAQNADAGEINKPDLTIVSHRHPDAQEWQDMMFAWKVAKHVKSNAIVYAKRWSHKGHWRRPDEPTGFVTHSHKKSR